MADEPLDPPKPMIEQPMPAVSSAAPSNVVVTSPPVLHWKTWHTTAVGIVVGLFVYLSVRPPDWGLRTFWIVGMLTLFGLTMIVGRGVTGVWKGAFVDERLKMSLSRLQMFVWTILVISAFGTMAIARLYSHEIDNASAMDIGVPETIWALLGISTTSLIGSPLIKSAKKNEPPKDPKIKVEAQGKDTTEVTWEGQIVKNRSIDDATFADLFRGENVENFMLLDMAKIQMFFFTFLLVLAYGASVGAALQDSELASLPDVGAGMLPLLGISHAGYLASKIVSTPASPMR